MQNNTLNSRKAVIWNILGSGINAITTMALTVATSWLGGIEASGVIGLAFGICFLFFSLACFEIRAYQSTDLEERFSFPVYQGTRLVTSGAAWLLCGGYLLLMGYDAEKSAVVFWICTFKILEAVSDVFQGDFQQKGYLEYAGQSLALKNLVGMALYIALYAVTGNLVLAAMGMPAASLLGLLLFDRRMARRMGEALRPAFHWRKTWQLLRECWPIAISSFMTMYVLNAAKIQIDRIYPELQGYWTALFMPASFANLFGLFVFRPMVTTLRADWNEKKLKDFTQVGLRLILLILGADACIVCAGAFMGIPVLEWLYHIQLEGRTGVLVLILIGGGFHALSNFLWYMVIVVRRQRAVVWVDGAVFLFSLLMVPVMIRAGELTGASLSYLCSTMGRAILLGILVYQEIHHARSKEGRIT